MTKNYSFIAVFRDFRNEPDGPKKEKMRDELRNMWFPLYFQKFTDIYNASSGEWVTGDSLTYGDLILGNSDNSTYKRFLLKQCS